MLVKASARDLSSREFIERFGGEFLFTTQQAALYMKLSESSLNHWRSSGSGPMFIKLNKSGARSSIRYRKREIDEFLDGRTFSSTAEAECARAMSRVSDCYTDLSNEHPYIVRNRWFIVSSVFSDRDTLISVFLDPFVKLAWLKPADAVAVPWAREDQRQELLAAYIAGQNDEEITKCEIERRYEEALGKIPDSNFGSHPTLTIKRYLEKQQAAVDALR